MRLHRGATEDDPVGLRQLLDTPGAVVLVDGWNVSMAGWPAATGAQQRDRLVSAVGALRTAADSVHLVFDGDDDGGRPAVSTPLPVRVHFSPGDTEADDVILGMVADLPATTPVVVVSSDGRVRRGAREHGANVAPSEALLALLGR